MKATSPSVTAAPSAVPSAPAGAAASRKLSVVIPAYNEEDGIVAIAERVLAVESSLRRVAVTGLEVIVVNDGSRDRTAELVSRIPGVKLISHETNYGYGAALKTGFSHATGELLAFLDADGTYPPESLPEMCAAVLGGADLVVGSRMAGARSDMPSVRRLGNRIFATMLSALCNERITDSASGMRVFRRDVLPRMYPLPDGLNFTPVMSTRAVHEGVKLKEIPIEYSERTGESKLSVVRDGLRFLNSIVWATLSYNPVRILGAIGLAGAGIAVLILAVLLAARLSGVTQLDNLGVFAVGTALIAAVSGISLFSLGATFNYLVSLFQRQPVRQGLFGRPLFKQPLDRQFGRIGGVLLAAGLLLGAVALALSFNGWDASRLWLWMLVAAMLILVGLQMLVSWVVMRVLEDLSQREVRTTADMKSKA
jgi:hypothetical protein